MEIVASADGPFAGKTGRTARRQGAKSVSKATDFVVMGADAGGRAAKAAKLGARTLTDADRREVAALAEHNVL